MEKTIYKYDLTLDDSVSLTLPKGAKFLKVGHQDGQLRAWFEVELAAGMDLEARTFAWRGTGHIVQDNLEHLESVIMPHYVWHFYEVTN